MSALTNVKKTTRYLVEKPAKCTRLFLVVHYINEILCLLCKILGHLYIKFQTLHLCS